MTLPKRDKSARARTPTRKRCPHLEPHTKSSSSCCRTSALVPSNNCQLALLTLTPSASSRSDPNGRQGCTRNCALCAGSASSGSRSAIARGDDGVPHVAVKTF